MVGWEFELEAVSGDAVELNEAELMVLEAMLDGGWSRVDESESMVKKGCVGGVCCCRSAEVGKWKNRDCHALTGTRHLAGVNSQSRVR